MPESPIEAVSAYRAEQITSLAEVAERLLLSPDLPSTGKGERVANALWAQLESYEHLVRAIHTSSSDQYAFKDLSPAEAQSYKRALHSIKLLKQIYGPQSA